jgi:hypothetical protein
MSAKYYLVVGSERRGPFNKAELESQDLRRETLVWRKGLPDWALAGSVAELLDIFDEPPPLPGREPAPLSSADRPPLPVPERMSIPERDGLPGSDQFKDPAVNLARTETAPPVYRDEMEEPRPSLRRVRIPYDAIGFRRLFLGGAFAFVPGLVLLLGFAILLGILALYGTDSAIPRFDPQRKDVVMVFDPGARTLGTVGAIFAVAFAVLGFVGVVSGAACFCVLLYRAWAIIYDGRTGPSPGRAVGFLFIPFFQLYWTFIAILGLAHDLNRFVRRYDLEAPTASHGLGFAICFYSVLTYVPIPLGLGPLTLGLILLPFFMRSVYRTCAAICDDANRDRIASTPLERSLRHPDLPRPVSAHILSVVGTVLALIGLALLVPGYCVGLDSLRHLNRDVRHAEVLRQAATHLRGLPALDQQDRNRLQDFENRANRIEQMTFHWRDDVIISVSVFCGGLLLIAIAITAALVARACAKSSEEAGGQLVPPWPVTQGAGFLPKNARNPSRHSSVSRGAALP